VQMVQYALPAEAKAGGTAPLVLKFAGVSIPQRDNLTMKIFVHPKGVTPAPDSDAFVKQYYVGYKAFWKSPKAATEKGHHPATADIRVTVTRPNIAPDSVVTLVIARSVAAEGAEAGAAPEQLTFGAASAEFPR
jgi:hypothetical protein